MKFISGINPFFEKLSSKILSFNLQILGLKANFFSNLNLMLFLVVIPIIVAISLLVAHEKNNHYKVKPALNKYYRSFMLEWTFALLLFNMFNGMVSLSINFSNL